jgi:molybdenum cofactor cytidylyltransferase
MGRFKLLLPWRGRPVLDHVLEAARASRLGPRILVLGHEAAAIRAALDLNGFTVLHNSDYLSGQSSSMHVGLRAAPAACTGVLFLLGDQPAITTAFIDGLIALHASYPDRILVPTGQGHRSSPVLFPATLREELLTVTGDQGGRPVLDTHPELLRPVPVDDPALLLDLDEPSDLDPATHA